MVRPTKPKDIKPKADGAQGGVGGGNNMNVIIINTVITVLICILFLLGNFFIVKTIISGQMSHLAAADPHEEEIHEEEAPKPGIILDLGEFILNLNDLKQRRYLKINVALELSRKDSDPVPGEHSGGGGGHGHGHGGGALDPMELLNKEMEQYKPAIRDSIITILSSKSAEELSSVSGKERAKEQIKQAVNAIFHSERETLRVSFGAFIIQ